MAFTAAQLWLIPALPLAAAALGALTPRRAPKLAATFAIGAMVAAFVVSVLALSAALSQRAAGTPLSYFNFTWFELGRTWTMQLGWLLDPLGALMAVMVTFVGSLIFIFSLGYLRDDPNAARFFCFLSLFAAGMLTVLLANSLVLLFMAWELVGLASYLLIGFWFHKPAAAAAARKAFLTTRLGDIGLLLGIFWLHDAGGVLFYDAGKGCLEPHTLGVLSSVTVGGLAISTLAGLLIFCGAAGKSGQFPLHVWLPDAMEGPTPVSALIHAATMVAAGVFLVVRVYPLLAADQALTDVSVHALTVVAAIGTITALLGAVLAIAQNDLKRVLAYSTVSQLGYMMLAVGVGAWTAAIFHLLTHAFFKALLFLGAGSVIHANHHEQDIRRLGGLRRSMPVTFATFAIGMLALSGAPLLFSGFWSKEAILHGAQHWAVSEIPFYVAIAGAGLTAFYMTRLTAEVFFGARRGTNTHGDESHAAHHGEHEPHENPRVMTLPLGLLAVGAIALGFLGTPAWPWLQAQLTGSALHLDLEHLAEGWKLMALSTLVVAAGMGLGWFCYLRSPRTSSATPDPLQRLAPWIFSALQRRLGFDELYAATVVRLVALCSALAAALDRWLWEGAARAVGAFARFVGLITRDSDEGGINAGFDRVTRLLRRSADAHSEAQTGEAHAYLRVVAAAFVVLAIFFIVGGTR